MSRLSLQTLASLPAGVRRPLFAPATLGTGMVHLGVGAFHRAHQLAFTDDAIEAAGGAWGVTGVCLRRPDSALALAPQDGLYTLEIRAAAPVRRVIGSLRRVLVAQATPEAVLDAVAAPEMHIIGLTVTEPAYALRPDGSLNTEDADVAHDLTGAGPPRSVAGWLVAGLARRQTLGAGGVTVLSCDNLRGNGAKLAEAVLTVARARDPALADWIAGEVAFPCSMVDAITPASDDSLRARVRAAIGLDDLAAVQREPYAQWVIEDAFAGPRPAWDQVGVDFTRDVAGHEALKLHVLNAAHSALAYLGLARGCTYVREAIADAEFAAFLDAMMAEEVGPSLPDRDVAGYWRRTRARFAEPNMDHRLDQIARDGAAKLRERIHPVLIDNLRHGRPAGRLAAVVRAWIDREGLLPASALDNATLFSAPFRDTPAVRAAVLTASPSPLHPTKAATT